MSGGVVILAGEPNYSFGLIVDVVVFDVDKYFLSDLKVVKGWEWMNRTVQRERCVRTRPLSLVSTSMPYCGE